MLQSILFAVAVASQSDVVLSSPSLSKPVTFSIRATDAVTAIKALAAASGAQLVATSVMKPEVLIVRLDATPLRDAMVKIADACGGSWTQEKGVYYLGRTTEEEHKRMESARASEMAALQKAIAEAKARIAAAKPFDEDAANALAKQVKDYQGGIDQPGRVYDLKSIRGFSGQEPIGRLEDAVLASIDPKAILDSPAGHRAVYSTDPDSMELPLKIDIAGAVSQFLKTQSIWAKVMKPTDANAVPRVGLPFSTDNAIVEPVSKLDVVIDRTQEMGPTMELEIIGSAGNVEASTQRPIVPDPPMPELATMIAKSGETKLEASADELAEMRALAIAMGEPAVSTPLSEVAREHLSQPDRYDPLGTYVSSFYLQTAEALGKNLVADVPDAYIMLGPAAAKITVPTATSWLKMTQAIGSLIAPTEVDDKWIEIAGGRAAPNNQLALRANRQLLANLFADAKSGGLSTEALARYAFESGQSTPDFMSVAKVATLAGSIEFERWDTLRVLGAMLARDNETKIRSESVPFTSLDRPTIELLTEIVFYEHTNLSRTIRGAPGEPFAFHGTEPCDAMPQGLPRSGSISVASTESIAAYSDGPRPQPWNAQSLAWNTHMKSHPDQYPANSIGGTIADKFRMGTQRTVSITIQLAQGLGLNLSYDEHHAPSGDALSFDQLPPDFVAEVKKNIALYEQTR